ncbi:hypothetical protein K431DRAFT_310248 [Polychaeton citri CBS 116435]|uniref:Protein kinase domain-containing protein n=1 Tax=Polychaeton citri CBS 116435 TaxID=1314669 RepID=A0A9P4QEC6_9PEZI|nr:hypothetical protein K431DRAFT_310248 [Polychaeton citri CBS 116435]
MDGNTVIVECEGNRSYDYSYGVHPASFADLDARATAAEIIMADDLIVTHSGSDRNIENCVRTEDGRALFFRPRTDLTQPEFAREVSVLMRITELQLHQKAKLSNLTGLVMLEDGLIAGIAMPWLPALSLANEVNLCRYEYHTQWERQTRRIVETLHAHCIVWGDVNPHNILIDSALDAWAIDFGGNHNVDFIDSKNNETIKGDWQGVDRISREWLPEMAQVER